MRIKTPTVNFQNNAPIQINAWFKLTPGTKNTVYNLYTVFVIQKNAWFNLTHRLMAFENNERPGHIFEKYGIYTGNTVCSVIGALQTTNRSITRSDCST